MLAAAVGSAHCLFSASFLALQVDIRTQFTLKSQVRVEVKILNSHHD